MSEWSIKTFVERGSLDSQLSEDVAALLRAAIADRGEASLVVSGGSTPMGFFRQLSQQDLDWSRLIVTLADDRWVPQIHSDSNERLVRETLLTGRASDARFVSLVTGDEHPQAGQAEVAARLAELAALDVVILGMGGDGHFASLFPGSSALADGLDLTNGNNCITVDPPSAPHARMSMTLRRLLDTRHLIVHIVGDEKRCVLERAAQEDDAMSLPVAAVLTAHSPAAQVYWAP